MLKYAVLGTALVALAACQDSTSPRATAELPARVNAAQGVAPNDYIVVFRSDESDPDGQANALVKAHGGSLTHVYRTALKGFAVSGLPDAAVAALQRNPRIAFVERDGIMTANGAGVEAPTPSWGLDRIDAASGLNSSYTYPNDGTGVTAYIVDTGINATNTDFSGRILTGSDFVDGGAPDDCNGHGTHVAGTVGGTKYGVAKNVRIVAVRVLNCQGSGTTTNVIAGIDWVAANAIKPAVANMSLGGGKFQALNDAVAGAVSKGVTFAVAAGNSTADACNSSPSSEPLAITVGATTTSDAIASYSNYGTCVDINAPGSGITSDWMGTSTATNTISGTSMASPHVAGAAALYLAANPTATPADVANALTGQATPNVLTNVGAGTPNKLLYIGRIGAGVIGGPSTPPSGDPVPVAGISKSCDVWVCTFTSTSTGPIATYKWDFGGGDVRTITTSASQQKTYAARQSGSVTLTVSNSAGAGSSATASVVCNPKKCQ
jgi:subtilisin family serine protease